MKNVKPEDIKVIRRTFEAAKHPKGSEERARLNMNAETSEYMPSMRYMVRWPFLMNDGTPHPTQPFQHGSYRTKKEAEIWAETMRKNS